MKITKKLFAIFLSMFFLVSCATTKNIFPPEDFSEATNNVKIFEGTFTDTWEAIMLYASRNFFGIENIKKDSGFLTLSYNAGNINRLVDCGQIEVNYVDGSTDKGSLINHYQAKRNMDLQLNIKMNVFASELQNEETRVEVNTRYLLTFIHISDGGVDRDHVVFYTGKANLSPGGRLCKPTHVIENNFLEGIVIEGTTVREELEFDFQDLETNNIDPSVSP